MKRMNGNKIWKRLVTFIVIAVLLSQDIAWAGSYNLDLSRGKLASRSLLKLVERYADKEARRFYLQTIALDDYLRDVAKVEDISKKSKLRLMPSWIGEGNFFSVSVKDSRAEVDYIVFPIKFLGKKAELYFFRHKEKIQVDTGVGIRNEDDLGIARKRGYWIKMISDSGEVERPSAEGKGFNRSNHIQQIKTILYIVAAATLLVWAMSNFAAYLYEGFKAPGYMMQAYFCYLFGSEEYLMNGNLPYGNEDIDFRGYFKNPYLGSPINIILFYPFVLLSNLVSLLFSQQVFFYGSIFIWTFLFILLKRTLSPTQEPSSRYKLAKDMAVFSLLFNRPFLENLFLGQINILYLTPFILGLVLYLNKKGFAGKSILIGFLFALAGWIKIYPWIILIVFALPTIIALKGYFRGKQNGYYREETKIFVSSILFSIGIGLLIGAYFGFDIFTQWYRTLTNTTMPIPSFRIMDYSKGLVDLKNLFLVTFPVFFTLVVYRSYKNLKNLIKKENILPFFSIMISSIPCIFFLPYSYHFQILTIAALITFIYLFTDKNMVKNNILRILSKILVVISLITFPGYVLNNYGFIKDIPVLSAVLGILSKIDLTTTSILVFLVNLFAISNTAKGRKDTGREKGDSSGLIGKYILTSRIEFIEGYIHFKAYHVDDPKRQEIEIKIGARKVSSEIFRKYRNTGIAEIDNGLNNFLSSFDGEVFILASNPYGIGGIGTRDTLAVLESFKDNDIALFHELAHAAGIDVVKYINAGREELYLYLRSKGPQMSQHYAIRLFQRQKWESDDRALTRLIKIDRLKTESDRRKRIEIAKQLGLDTRPTESGLLDVQYVGHDMAVKDIVNPNNEHKVAVYGCSGADWSNIILSTNADSIYFVDRTPIDVEKLERLLATEWDKLNDIAYLLFKYAHGYSLSEATMPEIEYKILLELKLMGVKKDTIRITNNTDGSVTIRFNWAYKGQGTREYSITYIQADIKRPSEYPDALKKVLERGIDIYYQRAALGISDWHHEIIHEISRAIKEGGYILADGAPYYEGVIYIEELKHWERLIEFLDPVKVGNPLYGRFVNVWQKKSIMTRDKFKSIYEEDIEFTRGLLLGISEERVYEIRYDASRLSDSQQEIIKTYIDILRKKLNIVAKPFKGAKRDYVLKVICKNNRGKVFAEGGVDVEGEGNLEDSPLRIIGMLNIAFAASNIIDEPSVDDPLIRFIQYQYKAITGEELGEEASIKKIILPRPERMNLNELDRLNRMAVEMLISA